MTTVVALTGGIGSGKSTASAIFSSLGVPVIDADVIAHQLTAPKQPALKAIIDHFGNEVIKPNGELDRKRLRDRVFNDPVAKKTIEYILHPLIHAEIVNQLKIVYEPYCLVVIPLLAEHYAQYEDLIDQVIVMDTPPELQREWALARESRAAPVIDLILKQQCPQYERVKIADILLTNDGSLASLRSNIEAIHQQLLDLST